MIYSPFKIFIINIRRYYLLIFILCLSQVQLFLFNPQLIQYGGSFFSAVLQLSQTFLSNSITSPQSSHLLVKSELNILSITIFKSSVILLHKAQFWQKLHRRYLLYPLIVTHLCIRQGNHDNPKLPAPLFHRYRQ